MALSATSRRGEDFQAQPEDKVLIYWIYERLIERQLCLLPVHTCVMITEQDMHDAPEKIISCTRWFIDISEGVAARTSGISVRGISREMKCLPLTAIVSGV